MSISFKRFIQIAGVKDREEADMLVNCGVRFLGFPLRLAVHEPDLSEAEAAEIIRSLTPPNYGVIITYLVNADEIVKFCKSMGCSVIQLHEDISAEELAKVKMIMPEITIIKSLVVGKDNQSALINDVKKLESYVDAFITDTYDPATGAKGATGKLHDWNVSRALIDISSKPVILAGGLNNSNVYDAVKSTSPAGVDSHTGVEGSDGRKDEALVRQFVSEANRAFNEIEAGI